jgi:hypothetical protein
VRGRIGRSAVRERYLRAVDKAKTVSELIGHPCERHLGGVIFRVSAADVGVRTIDFVQKAFWVKALQLRRVREQFAGFSPEVMEIIWIGILSRWKSLRRRGRRFEQGGLAAPKRCHPQPGGPLLSCIFSAIINDAALRPPIRWPRCHFRLSSSFESNEVRHDK